MKKLICGKERYEKMIEDEYFKIVKNLEQSLNKCSCGEMPKLITIYENGNMTYGVKCCNCGKSTIRKYSLIVTAINKWNEMNMENE